MDLFVSDSWNPRPTELTEPQGQNGSQKGRFFNYQCYTPNFSYVPLHYLLVCREITSQYPRPASVLPAGSVGGEKVINFVGRGLEPYSGQSFSLFLFGPVSSTRANAQKGISTHRNSPLNYLDISSLWCLCLLCIWQLHMCSCRNIHVNDQSPLKSNFVFPSIHSGGNSDKSVIVFSESN